MPTQVTNYQCPACTGPLHYSAKSGKLACDYCGSSFDVAEIEALYARKETEAAAAKQATDAKAEAAQAAKAEAAEAAAASGGWDTSDLSRDWGAEADGLRVYSCPSCGAELICDQSTAAMACPYCGNPAIVPGQFSGALRPDYILPFRLSKDDAVQALRIMAGLEAGATGYTADKVGIVGSSAGGHLAAMASTIGSFKPAFSVLFYPVITAVQGKRHQGSFINLLSEQRTPEQDAAYSLESRVTADTPPAILLLSDDDKTVPPVNSTLYYNALKAHGIEASMHIYPSGGHGWGIRDSFRYKAQWQDAVLDWLRRINE